MIDVNAQSIQRARSALTKAEDTLTEARQGAWDSERGDRLRTQAATYRAVAESWLKIAELTGR